MSRDAGLAHLDIYLAQVGRRLQGLHDDEARETLAELRSHVLDRVGGDLSPASVEAAIAALGSPREVARLNVTERVATHVEADRSPLSVVRAIGRLASLSLYGFFAFLVTLTGYMTAAAFLVTAAVKPFAPDRAGLWWQTTASDPLTFSLGVVDHAPASRELLGWWIIPIGVAVGLGLGLLTWRFGLYSVRLMARTARRGQAPLA
jgi:uncharacterized membrane protein